MLRRGACLETSPFDKLSFFIRTTVSLKAQILQERGLTSNVVYLLQPSWRFGFANHAHGTTT
jgi:hypothetical protein